MRQGRDGSRLRTVAADPFLRFVSHFDSPSRAAFSATARSKLAEWGPLNRGERIMLGVFVMLLLWVVVGSAWWKLLGYW